MLQFGVLIVLGVTLHQVNLVEAGFDLANHIVLLNDLVEELEIVLFGLAVDGEHLLEEFELLEEAGVGRGHGMARFEELQRFGGTQAVEQHEVGGHDGGGARLASQAVDEHGEPGL